MTTKPAMLFLPGPSNMHYQFINQDTQEPADLAQVEFEFLEDLNDPTGLLEFSFLTMVGDYCTMSGAFDYSKFLHIATLLDLANSHIYLNFLHGKYHYKSYY